MNKSLFFIGTIIMLCLNISCKDSQTKKESEETGIPYIKEEFDDEIVSTPENKKNPIDFLPETYVTSDTIYGDLNKDGLEDLVYIIKGTDKSKIITDESRGKLDRNRRGIIILFKKGNDYELAVKNYDCFSSENEDGGVYFAPDLSVEIKKGKLYVDYSHGRYGYWSYTFRYQNNDLELIGYDSSSSNGPVVDSETSINFLTATKVENVNTNENAESGEEVFKKTETKLSKKKLIRLSEIKDFDELKFSEE